MHWRRLVHCFCRWKKRCHESYLTPEALTQGSIGRPSSKTAISNLMLVVARIHVFDRSPPVSCLVLGSRRYSLSILLNFDDHAFPAVVKT
jgi:hypothetical protein